MNLQLLERAIQKSRNIVCLLGINVSRECGCLDLRRGDKLYELEAKYGRAPEEIFSAAFYNTRTRQFFEFYQEEMLKHVGSPNEGLRTLARMEADGKLNAVVTREVYSLAKRAGCRNVLELHGSVYRNRCPRCGKEYNITYMRKGRPIPFCEECGTAIRPQVCLMGEMIDNQIMTAAVNEISKADLLLILGCNMNSMLATTCVRYFNGSKIILINDEKHYKDSLADLVCHGKTAEILPLIYPEKDKE